MTPMPVIRRSEPSLFASHIQSVEALGVGDIEYIHTQDVVVFDPRLCLTFAPCDLGNKVQIQRVIHSIPKIKTGIMGIRNERLIEIIKEYTFEEWDTGLTSELDIQNKE